MPKTTRIADPPRALVEGQRLDQPTFHSLYEAMPPGTRAELINGVVYMPSPAGLAHGIALVPVIVWLDYYAEQTPGLWLDPQALLNGDRKRPRDVLDLGCATPEHAAFVARLDNSRRVSEAK